ncbi:MAG TPA: ADP-ribosylglycohydrolase family protein [Methanocorpusculum sp.]|nr:ADP-ribosylglycohydrolase family protein [Methanocorpusculum sp.]
MTEDSRDMMLLRYKGCLLGAVLGDALGMPYETLPVRTPQPLSFKKAYRGHPNELLIPGQYTDDGQILLMSARILTDSPRFSKTAYAEELLRTHRLNKFRYPDGAVAAACKKMDKTKNLTEAGINSDSAGCLALAIPFALGFADKREMAKELSAACSITHTNTAAQAAAVGLALFLRTLIETGDMDAAFNALDTAAQNMYPELYIRLAHAYRAAADEKPASIAAVEIGTSSQVTQVIPLAAYLCRKCTSPEELLASAAACGGNAGTVAMICGAAAGARFGITSMPLDLIRNVERAAIFSELAEKLYFRAHPKIRNPVETAEENKEESEENPEQNSADKSEETSAEKTEN